MHERVMAKLASFLAMILVILSSCSATIDSPQLQTEFKNSINITQMTLQRVINAIEEEGEDASLGSLAKENSTEIIPREVLFGNLERTGVLISPDGKWISYLSILGGVFNVHVAPVDHISEAMPVTNETTNGVESYFWAFDNRSIIYSQDKFGDENWHIYAINIATGVKSDLTPYKNVSAYVWGISYKLPQELLIALNDRDPEYHDIYRVNITTGEKRLVQKNDERFAGFVFDDDLRVRLAANVTSNGDVDYLKLAQSGTFEPFMKIKYEDSATTYPIGFDRTGDHLIHV